MPPFGRLGTRLAGRKCCEPSHYRMRRIIPPQTARRRAAESRCSPCGAFGFADVLSVALQPCATVEVDVSGGERDSLATAALAAEAVLLFEAAGEHFGEPPDLDVQRPGRSGVHLMPRIAPRWSRESEAPAVSGPAASSAKPAPQRARTKNHRSRDAASPIAGSVVHSNASPTAPREILRPLSQTRRSRTQARERQRSVTAGANRGGVAADDRDRFARVPPRSSRPQGSQVHSQ
jgi:hypothetical protein